LEKRRSASLGGTSHSAKATSSASSTHTPVAQKHHIAPVVATTAWPTPRESAPSSSQLGPNSAAAPLGIWVPESIAARTNISQPTAARMTPSDFTRSVNAKMQDVAKPDDDQLTQEERQTEIYRAEKNEDTQDRRRKETRTMGRCHSRNSTG
jgi:hypothetical protein